MHRPLHGRLTALALAALAAGYAAPAAGAAERGDIYLPEGLDTAQAEAIVYEAIPDPPEGWELHTHILTKRCRTLTEAKLQARAIEAGVHEIPCIALADDAGPYAVLPLHDLRAEDVEKARELATRPDRREKYQQRLFSAHVYQLCARTALCEQDAPKEMEAAITECRAVMGNKLCTDEQRQFLGLYCLYPLLMRQYAHGYTGAHSPATEAKLLEAIAALEEARDIIPNSPLGKKAHAERERLRFARRESRKYE